MRLSERQDRCVVEAKEAVSSLPRERTQERSDSSAFELSDVAGCWTGQRERSDSGSAAVALATRADAAGRRCAYERRELKPQMRRIAEGCSRPVDAAGLAVL